MNSLLAQRIRFSGFLVVGLAVMCGIFWPTDIGSTRHNASRTLCATNLKQISLAVRQYAQDYDDYLPSNHWGTAIRPYLKDDDLFHCYETSSVQGTSDYFWNARFLGVHTASIKTPSTLILMGDGANDSSLSATLTRIPASWCTDESSPAWRHLNTANYAFADGHVKWLKVNHVNRNFRRVNP